MCGQAEVGGQAIMPCPEAAKLEQDVWALMQAIAQRDATIAQQAEALADAKREIEHRIDQYSEENRHRTEAVRDLRKAETDLAASRAMSALWKAEAKKGRKGEVTLLVAVCRSQETINELLTERDDWKRAWHEMTEIVASHYSKLQDSRADAARLREACYEPRFDDHHYLGGYRCRLCGWDVAPDILESHDPSCALFADAAATPPAPANTAILTFNVNDLPEAEVRICNHYQPAPDAGRTVAGSLAAMALRESFDAGNEISVPSLGISFKKQEPAPNEGAGSGDQ